MSGIGCPKCHGDKFSVISATMVRCTYCGCVYELPSNTPKNTQTCPVCGELIEKGLEVCPVCHERICGEKVVVKVNQPQQPRPQSTDVNGSDGNHKIWIILSIIIGLALVIGIVWYAVAQKQAKVTPNGEEVVDSVAIPAYNPYTDEATSNYDEAVPDYEEAVANEENEYTPDTEAAKRAVKAMYHEIIADCKRNTDGERMRKKYLTEDFKDFYDMAIKVDERLHRGEVGEFNGCNLLTQSQDFGTENDITILDLTCERGGLDESGFYYVAHIKLWGNTISLILMGGDNGRFYIDDINGWKYDMKLYVVRNLE